MGLVAPAVSWAQGTPAGVVDSGWMLLAWLLFGLACAALGALWSRRGLERQLRPAREEAQAWRQLQSGGHWRTDADHRLSQWHPPADAGTAWPAAQTRPAPLLSDLFEPADPAQPTGDRLDALLQDQAAWEQCPVRSLLDGSLWTLSARPCLDGSGRFAGYLGSARPLAGQAQALRDGALLAQLWPQLGLAALVLEEAAPGLWRVQRASPALGTLLRVEAASLIGQDWAPLCARLPAPLGEGLVGLDTGQTRDLGEWQVRLQALALPAPAPAARLLTLHARTTVTTDTAADERDQESFIYSISHDLRAPIRVVEGFSRILKEDYGRFLDRIGNDHLDRVLAAAARMHSMIDALLALSRLQSQPLMRKPVDLSQLATYVMEDLRREQPDRAAEVSIEAGLVVQGDPTLLRMALENLLGNAWKYSGQCPLTRIEFRREALDGRTVYVVADRGAGFDMRFADRLFGVFQRLHSAKDFQGTGVGLASVRRIVRRHGGDIWAESEVGQGARFYFTLAP